MQSSEIDQFTHVQIKNELATKDATLLNVQHRLCICYSLSQRLLQAETQISSEKSPKMIKSLEQLSAQMLRNSVSNQSPESGQIVFADGEKGKRSGLPVSPKTLECKT